VACEFPPGPPGTITANASGGDPARAFYIAATGRYAHGILGDAIEAGGLVVQTRADLAKGGCGAVVMLPQTSVFEDTGPRLTDLNGDGRNEVIVVETDRRIGAQLAIYALRGGALQKIAATPHIGQTHRWLAPAGIGDFDGDGRINIAYVETPHLGKTLRLVALKVGALVEIAAGTGLTNHRIGDRQISGGARDCGAGDQIVLADGAWTRVIAARVHDGRIVARDLGPLNGPGDFAAALACER
jgi:hypothetical protein